jgi:hypothetical protein
LPRDSSSALTIFLTIRSRITNFRRVAKPGDNETILHRTIEISIVRLASAGFPIHPPFVKGAANVHRIPSRVRDDRDTPVRWDETR